MKGVKLIIILIFLILIPNVLAEIKLNSFSQTNYNIGEKVLISGTVKEDKAVRAYLNVALNCGSNTGQVAAILIDIESNKEKPYSQLVSLTKNLIGDCTIKTSLNEINTNNAIEIKEFTGFKVSNDLNGQFEINKKELQLGDILNIKGRATAINGNLINGIATIYYKQGDNSLFVDITRIINGELSYNKSMGLIPTGSYNLDIEISDNIGNSHFYTKLYDLTISGKLEPLLNFDKNIYDPGDNVNINGIITGNYNKILNDLTIEFLFDGKEKISKTLKSSTEPFSLIYKLQKDAKTGIHNINILTKNAEGNFGQAIINFTVKAIPTTLTITIDNNKSILPEENIGFNLVLLDQAGDQINENILTGLLNSDNKIIDTKVVKTNTHDNTKIPKSSEPGIWKIRAEGLGLHADNSFTVAEKKTLEITIEGTILHVLNTGNVIFKEDLQIQANNTNFNEALNLKVGKTDDIKLDKFLPNGLFDVYIPFTQQTFKDVRINKPPTVLDGLKVFSGNVASNVQKPERKIGLYLLLALLTGSMVFFILKRKGRNVNNYEDYQRKQGYEQGRKKLEELRRKGIRKDTQEYGKATKEDVEDFKQRMQQVWKEEENKNTRQEFVNQQQKNINQDKPSNYFGRMFD